MNSDQDNNQRLPVKHSTSDIQIQPETAAQAVMGHLPGSDAIEPDEKIQIAREEGYDPMAIDLARWMFMLQLAGRKGLVPELAFFFKHPLGENAARTFQDQLAALDQLESEIINKLQ